VPRPRLHPSRGRWLLVTVLILLAIIAVPTILLIAQWPFTPQKVARNLEEATGSKVEIKSFQRVYLPRPGCIAQGLTFRRGSDPNQPPVMTIERLHILSSMLGLFGSHVAKIIAEGVHVVMPPLGSESGAKPASDIVVGELVTKDAVFEFLRRNPAEPRVQFLVRTLSLKNLGRRTTITFYTAVRVPEPPGEAEIQGTLGPFKQNQNAEAPGAGTSPVQTADP